METPVLYMAILGATLPGRLTEQHDVFFGIGPSLRSLKEAILSSWPEAGGRVHIDSWRKVTTVGHYRINIVPAKQYAPGDRELFFSTWADTDGEIWRNIIIKCCA